MVLHQSNFYMKSYQSKYFRVMFHLLKYYQNQNLQIIRTIFNTNFLKLIVLHFYIASAPISFCFV